MQKNRNTESRWARLLLESYQNFILISCKIKEPDSWDKKNTFKNTNHSLIFKMHRDFTKSYPSATDVWYETYWTLRITYRWFLSESKHGIVKPCLPGWPNRLMRLLYDYLRRFESTWGAKLKACLPNPLDPGNMGLWVVLSGHFCASPHVGHARRKQACIKLQEPQI